ncbi:Rab escort protein 1 [Glycine soja]
MVLGGTMKSPLASLSFHDLTSYLTSPHSLPSAATATTSSNSDNIVVVDLVHQPLCTDTETTTYDESVFLSENSQKFNIDLGGPRALFCADKTIDLLMKSGAA